MIFLVIVLITGKIQILDGKNVMIQRTTQSKELTRSRIWCSEKISFTDTDNETAVDHSPHEEVAECQ